MLVKQIYGMLDPVSHWTFDSYTGSNVFDDQNNATLVNFGATLGAAGGPNLNYSPRSVNLKGGHLQVLDGTFLGSELILRDVSITFNFKADAPVAGFRPMVQKWSPEQVFMIGFENSKLVAKIQTTSSLIELEIDVPSMLFSGKWNTVQLRILPSEFEFWCNGIKRSVSNTDGIAASAITQFTVGGTGVEEFTTDVFVSDLALLTRNDDTSDVHAYAVFKLPRTDEECWLVHAPTYFFNIIDQVDLTAPIVNKGSKGTGINGYLITQPGSTAPYRYNPTSVLNREYVLMPTNSWFTIDDDLQLGFNTGMTLLVDGYMDVSINGGNINRFTSNIIDMGETFGSDNNRVQVSFEDSGSNEWFGIKTYDAGGSIIYDNGYPGDYGVSDYYGDHGIHRLSWKAGLFKHTAIRMFEWYARESTDALTFGTYNPVSPLTYNRIWWNTGSYSSTESALRTIAIFDYDLDYDSMQSIHYQRDWLVKHLYQNAGYGLRLRHDGYWNSGDPEVRYYQSGPSYSMLNNYYGTTYANPFNDSLGNRPNEYSGSTFLNLTNYYYGQYFSEDNNQINTGDFTVSLFVDNRNTTDAYRLFGYVNGGSNGGSGSGTINMGVHMNQRDGVFSEGDIEFTLDNFVSRNVSTDSKTFKGGGFHMLTVIRRGLNLEIWVDGILEQINQIGDLYNIGSSDRAFRVYGGPNYTNEFLQLNRAVEPKEIEFWFRGFGDSISGQTLINGAPIQADLISVSVENGQLLNQSQSDVNGNYTHTMGKFDGHQVNVMALPTDFNQTNNVVVHGPYNISTTYEKYLNEVLDRSIKNMIIDMDPVRYYPLDELSGTDALDASGNGHHGTYVGGVTLGQESFKLGLVAPSFDGTTSHVTLPVDNTDFGNGVTYEFWAKPTSAAANARFIEMASALAGVDAITANRGIVSNDLSFSFKDTGNTTQFNVAPGVLTANVWKHYVCRVIPETLTSEVWVNGILVNSESVTTMPKVVSRAQNWIGRGSYNAFPSNDDYAGGIANVAVYDYPLPIEDMEKHRRAGLNLNSPTLKSVIKNDNPNRYWTFDRATPLDDETTGETLATTGSVGEKRNALTLNAGVVGNNYLQAISTLPANVFTLELSFKTFGTHTDAILVSEWNQGTDTGVYKLQLNANNTITFHATNGVSVLTSSILYNDNKWHHVVVTCDGTTTALWVDGSKEASLQVAYPANTGQLLTIGNDSDGSVTHFTELETHIDDLALYNYAMNDTKIATHNAQFVKKKQYT